MLPFFVLLLVLALTVFAIAVFARGLAKTVGIIRQGKPAKGRLTSVGRRLWHMLAAAISHLRFRTSSPWIALAHAAIFFSFPLLFTTLATAYGQLVNPHYALPIIGHFWLWNWLTELLAWASLFGVLFLWVRRWRLGSGKKSRFFGSNQAGAYFVEFVVFGVVVCVLLLQGMEALQTARAGNALYTPDFSVGNEASGKHLYVPIDYFSYPITGWIGEILGSFYVSNVALGWSISIVALIKILISLSWLIVVGLVPSMGVAWHRFLAFASLYTAKLPGEKTASLGPLLPLEVNGESVTLESLENLPEDAHLGLTELSDLTWKQRLDVVSCTECGRCQDVCPAWQAGSPLSPKLLVIGLRDQLYDKSPQLNIWQNPTALWDCTECGACTSVCPVEIEHVDLIGSLRRGAVLTEGNAPKDLAKAYKNLEKKANPFGGPAKKRLDWTKNCSVPVPVLGQDVESLADVDCLLWVGCAGAFDEHGQKTTRAVAELLTLAGVKFCVLGAAENCTGDPARRSGNELLYQELARTNIEMLKEYGATRETLILTSCAHCFNTFAREYPQLNGTYRVLHHTQYLNQLVRSGRLRPQAAKTQSTRELKTGITYHDPCYLGRHNDEFEAPRSLITASSGGVVEMPRNKTLAACCGAGGSHAFFEGQSTKEIPLSRAKEAIETGAEVVATACPFCATMLSNGVSSCRTMCAPIGGSSAASSATTIVPGTPAAAIAGSVNASVAGEKTDHKAAKPSPKNSGNASDTADKADENGAKTAPEIKVVDVAVLLLEAVHRGGQIYQ